MVAPHRYGAAPLSQKYRVSSPYSLYTSHLTQVHPFFSMGWVFAFPRAQKRKGVGGEGRLGQVPQYSMHMARFSGVSSTGTLPTCPVS